MMRACLLALSIAAMLAVGAPPALAQFQAGGVDREGSWYVGEGLKQGDYFHYSMCHVHYKECVEFEMEFWIRGDVMSGSEVKWLAEAVVYDGNRVIVGEMELGKIAPEPTGGSDELGTYRGAFKSSVVWLSAFATVDTGTSGKGPKEFSAKSWGKIANIGGEQVVPMEIVSVRTPADTWDTVQIGWKTGGVTSRVWIVDDFPFPVKAKTFTHVSEGIPPVEYEFELLEYEEGVEASPFEDIQPTAQILAGAGCETDIEKESVVKKSTRNFAYQIHAFYGPAEPVSGCPMEWLIKFISKYDDTEFLNQVHFDFIVLDGGQFPPERSIAQDEGREFLYSPSGQYELDMIVEEGPGDVTYTVWVYGLAPEEWVPDDVPDYLDITIPVYPGSEGAAPVAAPAIPGWIKTSTGLWVDGQTDDDTFAAGMQFLIQEGIIEIPPTTQGEPGAAGIPDWIKIGAGLWVDGQTDDETFAASIQFLIREGVIALS